eukprot:scaffold307214_cov16-Tisochrysis_lutea.AAC.1
MAASLYQPGGQLTTLSLQWLVDVPSSCHCHSLRTKSINLHLLAPEQHCLPGAACGLAQYVAQHARLVHHFLFVRFVEFKLLRPLSLALLKHPESGHTFPTCWQQPGVKTKRASIAVSKTSKG